MKVLEAGGYFGEVALINHAPRAADCVAASKLTVWRRSDSNKTIWPMIRCQYSICSATHARGGRT